MRYFCYHGHFYQPPREDPFTGVLPKEFGADPYHDWNERITAECYRPLAELGVFDLISFNLGPTLAAWMEVNAPDVYQRILQADRNHAQRQGVGNAIAQVYNHMLMPLATRRDKETQVAWGLADFRHRYGRVAEGMWLAECAVDLETLTVMQEQGVRFTILAPWQAEHSAVDSSEPQLIALPNGKQMTVFFFDEGLSRSTNHVPRISEDVQEYAEVAMQISTKWDKFKRDEDQLVLVATDGEYFGHHYKGRDLFMSNLLHTVAPANGWQVTSLSSYLRDHPAVNTVRLAERTAWSCYHGIDRWQKECGCYPGLGEWKAPFRRALDNLAAAIDDYFEVAGGELLRDPWAARNDYIQVRQGYEPVAQLLDRHASHQLDDAEQARAAAFLEAQYYRLLMYTSCAFFFEEFARIEPSNAIAYAARALDYHKAATGVDLQENFLAELRRIRGRASEMNGEQIYRYLARKQPVPRHRD